MALFYHIHPLFSVCNRQILTLWMDFVPASIIYHGAFLTYIVLVDVSMVFIWESSFCILWHLVSLKLAGSYGCERTCCFCPQPFIFQVQRKPLLVFSCCFFWVFIFLTSTEFTYISIYTTTLVIRFLAWSEAANWFLCGITWILAPVLPSPHLESKQNEFMDVFLPCVFTGNPVVKQWWSQSICISSTLRKQNKNWTSFYILVCFLCGKTTLISTRII